jgi:hypothetical protein
MSKEELAIFQAKPCDEVDKGSLAWQDKPTPKIKVTEECPKCHKENEVPYVFCECGQRRIASYG